MNRRQIESKVCSQNLCRDAKEKNKQSAVKKIFLALALAGCIFTANAQETESVSSPSKGDYFEGLTRPLTFNRMIPPYALEVTFSNYFIRSYDVCWPLAGMKSYVLHDSSFAPTSVKDVELLPWEADGQLADEMINRLLDELKGDIWVVGDHRLIASFAEMGLISEVVLNILPVTLGEGQRLTFGNRESNWTLADSKTHDNGVVQLKYLLKT